MEHQISTQELWNAVLASSKTTQSLLSAFECTGSSVVTEVMEPLRRLLQQEEAPTKKTCPISTPPTKKTCSISTPPTKKSCPISTPPTKSRIQKHDTLETNWERLEEGNSVCVNLKNGGTITAIAVTSETQLASIIPEILAADFITIDCEFLGIKNEMPILKLVQIAVSKQKGYAIQVDLVGKEGIARHLKPLLEDDAVNQVGWAYRADAMAIENYIHDIHMAPVLDLQSKLRPIAVEELSLHSAVARYAGQWEGYEDFMRVKQFRDGFSFSLHDCVWTKHPLPAKALVYSIFDVVCLFALAEAVMDHPNREEHYWPLTVTQGLNPKALDRWHRQRAIGKQTPVTSSSVQSSVASSLTQSPPVHLPSPRNKKKQWSAPEEVFYDDSNPLFQKDLKEAIQKSQQDQKNWHEDQQDLVEVDNWREELKENPTAAHFTQEHVQESPQASGWGEEEPVQKGWPYERPSRSKRPPRTETSKKTAGTQDSAKKTWGEKPPPKKATREEPTPRLSPKQPKQSPKTPFDSKPDREKYSAELKNRINSQTGKFSFVENKPEELAEAKWSQFATESEGRWKRGKDSSLSNIQTHYTPLPASPTKNKAFNTTVRPYSLEKDQRDSWDVVDEQPRSMEMQMNQVPIRNRFTGPKLNNPYDDGYDDEEDEEEEEEAKPDQRDTPAFVDDLYLNDGPDYLSVYKITVFKDLNLTIPIPTLPFTVAITYHTAKGSSTLKALQLYIATQDKGESYTVVLDQACMLRERSKYANTNLAYLLTHPDVKRITWYLNYVKESVKEKLGFYIGPSIDVSHIVCADLGKEQSFHNAAIHYLKDWPDFGQYQEKKSIQDKAANKTFGYAPWDEKKLRNSVLEHSAFCGLVLYKLYQSPKTIDHIDPSEFIVS